MRKLQWYFLLYLQLYSVASFAQTPVPASSIAINRQQFFTDDQPVELQINTDFKKMESQKIKGIYQVAAVTLRLPPSDGITENIRLYARGVFRRTNCGMPGIMLNFNNPASPKLSALKKLKLVCACGSSVYDEQLLLTEYLVYKMYNLLTERSFRARLTKVTFKDARSKMKEYTQYAFLLEDAGEMAKRNKCREVKKSFYLTEQTDRAQMTLVALFQYMIGNTDWAVPNNHNIRLIVPATDALARPFVVPYDFDFSGLVNAPYASPAPELGIENVTERVYRGFTRSYEEVDSTLQLFRMHKNDFLSLINNFEAIQKKDRGILSKYIENFYEAIKSKSSVKNLFVAGGRRE